MLLFPDPTTAQIDPFTAVPTLVLICDVQGPDHRAPTTARDPRYVAQKAEAYVKSTGIADTIYIGPELEFFIFDDVRFDQGYNFGYYHVERRERPLEQRPRGHAREPEPRLPGPRQAGLLPGVARRPPPGPALRDGDATSRASA